jgi:mannose-1-phosphate guanylyltransferase
MVQVWPKDDQNNVHHGEMMALDSRHNVVFSKQKLCVLLGVENLIVVDTEDALLVCPVHKAQDIGKILEVIRQRGMEQYL